MTHPDPNSLLTTTEAAQVASVHLNSIRGWIKAGDLVPTITVKGLRLFSPEDVIRVANEKRARRPLVTLEGQL